MISDNIKNLRLKHHLTQAELGKIAGVSDKAVSTWESGKALPRIGAVQKMADHFGIPKSEIVDEDGDAEKLSDDEKVVIEYFRSFNDKEQRRLMRYLEFILESIRNEKE